MERTVFAARVWAKLVAFERAERLFSRGDRVLAAVSGGPDSVCLAHYLSQRARRGGFFVTLIHLDHGLRGAESRGDAAFVRALGEALGVPVVTRSIPVARRARARGKGLEDAGRELRYAAIAREARRLSCNKAAAGHHLDDQAETVLLHLLRGTSLKGLGGIPPRRALAPGLALVRPLLPLRRSEIMLYLERHGLKHRTDRSNESLDFTRNWVRKKVLPLLETKQPRLREHLAALASQARSGR
jgi:tRNA(Ile)-lysidine synthase